MHGKGVYSWPGIQQCYVGQWKDGKRHGHGRHYFNSSSPDADDDDSSLTVGDYYDGEWKEGVMHGKARYVDAGGEEHEGLWVNGVCPEVVRRKPLDDDFGSGQDNPRFNLLPLFRGPCPVSSNVKEGTWYFFNMQPHARTDAQLVFPNAAKHFPLFRFRISRTCRKVETFGTASR